jgi:glutamyl-tRNA reductase
MPRPISQSIEDARREELERALRLLRSGRDAAQVLETLSRRLTNKLLHEPTQELRECTGTY